MKKVFYLVLCIGISKSVFSQPKLQDGIYLVDQLKERKPASQTNTTAIQFNPLFVEENPDEYEPVIIFTDDFVPFELAATPVIQTQKDQQNFLLVHLSKNATEKLTAFTKANMLHNIAVVVNGQVLSIYKITYPVINREIEITKCSGEGCKQIYKRLKNSIQK